MIESDHLSFLPVSRRGLLRAGAAAAAGVIAGRAASAAPRQSAPVPARPDHTIRDGKRPAKNVIFMVSDGMSLGTLSLGDMLIRRSTGKPSHWANLWAKPGARRALQQTSCADSLVTDSAAGACAWGSGRHINLGAMNVMPDGAQLLPILIQAKQAGKMTGVVTTARVTHATPAGFYANAPRRDLENLIAGDLLDRGIDIGLGGGARSFTPELLAKYPGVTVVRDAAQLKAAGPTGRLLGLFSQSHVPFVMEREATVPSLPEMTLAALSRLGKAAEGFVLQIEAGRVDHAAHNNDAGALLREQVEFDQTIGTVMDWLGDRDDTLLIVTTDHANANPGLTLYMQDGAHGLDRAAQAKRSFDWIDDELKRVAKAEGRGAIDAHLADIVRTASGITVDPVELELLRDSMKEGARRVDAFEPASKWPGVLGAVLANHFSIAFASPNHTADLTEVTAYGPGSHFIAPFIDNTDLHAVMVSALALAPGKMLDGMDQPMVPVSRPKAD